MNFNKWILKIKMTISLMFMLEISQKDIVLFSTCKNGRNFDFCLENKFF